MKRAHLALFAAILGASFTAACSGGGSNATPPAATGNFSNASLKGSYVYTMTGQDLNTGGIVQRVGSFTADGNGNITAGIEDLDIAGTVSTGIAFSAGSYSIQANGRGTMTLSGTAGSVGLSVTLTSTNGGLMIENDLNRTGSGSFTLQNTSAFTVSGINNNYVFDVSGVDGNGSVLSMIGQLKTNSAGVVNGGTVDVNDGSTELVSGTETFASGTYSQDPNNPNTLASFGRGAISFVGLPAGNGNSATLTFIFYIVDSTHFKLMEADGQAFVIGEADQQSSSIASLTTATWTPGSFTHLIGGGSSAGADSRAASYTTNGSGTLSNINWDDNNDGNFSSQTSSSLSGTYSIDANHPGTGHGNITINFNGSSNSFQAGFYLIDATHGFIQNQSAGIIGDGTFAAQGSGTLPNGNYAFNWSGVTNPNTNAAFEEDFVGQYTLPTASGQTFNGAMDFAEFSNNTFFSDVAITVSGTFNGTGSNAFKLVSGTSPSTTYDFKGYVTADGTVLFISSDTTRVTAGIIQSQP